MPNQPNNSTEIARDQGLRASRRGIYVSAFICERLLTETNNVVTAVRLVDLFNLQLPPPKPNSLTYTPPLEAELVVQFKSEKPERFTAGIVLVKPSCERLPPSEYHCETSGSVMGHMLMVHLKLDAAEAGDYWIEIFIDDELSTKVPLRITQNVARPAETRHGAPPNTAGPS